MLRLTKKKFVLGAATVCVMAVAAGAYAYFATTGSGTATATVGSASAVTLNGTVSGNLYPGSYATVSFTVDNPSTGRQRVGTITLSELKVDAGHSGCLASNFAMAPVPVNATYGPGNAQVVSATGKLEMLETNESQNVCQGAKLTLVLTS